MSETHRIGAFRLHSVVGRGGMGTVWAAQHERLGLPVAVKILQERFTQQSWFVTSFANEVRAVARLQHPNIVRILDHGSVGSGAPGLRDHGVGPASPWLAMERCAGAPLSRLRGELSWPSLRRVLLGLLDALAHAHARGVLHRDIKPGNVMVSDDAVKLLDFGIARVADEPGAGPADDDDGAVVGTAAYMAPEQFDGWPGGLGPWTDLYALGCTAWSVVTGEPPFGRRRPLPHLRDDHCHTPLPPLQPVFSVPAALEGWLRGLLDKDPGRRFQRAADAAWALRALQPSGRPPQTVADATTWRWTTAPTVDPAAPTLTPTAQDRVPPSEPRPPLPDTWRSDAEDADAPRLLGAGLRLFGLRSVPLIGRDDHRDALWRALGHTVEGRQRAVVLQGPAGTGKSALASWLSERAHELGAASTLTAHWSAGGSAGDGLATAVRRWLRCQGATIERCRQQVEVAAQRWQLDPLETRDLRALVGASDSRRFASAGDRHAALARILAKAARRRPVLLRLEDVHWGADGLAFALHALRLWRDQGAAVLLLLTSREVRPDTPEALLLDRLQAWPEASRLEVGPLAPGWRTALIRELLTLDGNLARAVEHRTAGNPLFITQLVGDWVQRGLLVPGPVGLELRPGAHPDLPDDLHSVWTGRVARALEGRDRLERRALEVAAILGMVVDRGEWKRACRHAGAWPNPQLVEVLLNAGLVEPGPEGAAASFTFVHGMLRESLVRAAEEAGRADAARRGCVEMLREHGDPEGRDALRLGRLLVALGDDDGAVDPLARGAWSAVVDSEYLVAAEALEDREEALARLDLAPDDRRPCEGWIMAARVARRRGDAAAAALWTARAESAAREAGWPGLLLQALREQARLADAAGQRAAALQALSEAVSLSKDRDDAVARAWCRRDLGLLQVEAGAPDRQVDERLALAQTTFRREGEVFGEATCTLARARAAHRAGRLDRARRLAADAERGFHDSLAVQEPAHALVGRAEAALLRDDGQAALVHSRAAQARFAEIGNPGTPVATLVFAEALLRQGLFDEAGGVLRDELRRLTTGGMPGLLAPVYGLLAWMGAATGDLGVAEAALDGLLRHHAASGTAEPRAADACDRCAQAAVRHRMGDLAERAEAIADAVRERPGG